MKRVLFLFIFSACIANVFAQDIILLNQEDTTVYRYDCGIQFTKRGSAGNTSLEITIKYTGYDGVVLLFNQKCTEKELKKRKINKNFPKIYFDEIYNGTNEINKFIAGLEKSVLLKPGSDPTRLPSVYDIRSEKDIDIKIPLYFGTIKKKKIYLTKNDELLFRVRIPAPLDNDYSQFLLDYEELNNDVMNAAPFCPNKAHKESQDIEKYKEKQEQLVKKIKEKQTRVFGQTNIDNYKDLLKKVENIKFEEKDCGRHKGVQISTKQAHSCNVCINNKTLDDISRKLMVISNKLYNRTIDKSKALKDAEELYKACTTSSCSIFNSLWKKGDKKIKKTIEDYYNDIKNSKE